MPVFENPSANVQIKDAQQSLSGFIASAIQFDKIFEKILTIWPELKFNINFNEKRILIDEV